MVNLIPVLQIILKKHAVSLSYVVFNQWYGVLTGLTDRWPTLEWHYWESSKFKACLSSVPKKTVESVTSTRTATTIRLNIWLQNVPVQTNASLHLNYAFIYFEMTVASAELSKDGSSTCHHTVLCQPAHRNDILLFLRLPKYLRFNATENFIFAMCSQNHS